MQLMMRSGRATMQEIDVITVYYIFCAIFVNSISEIKIYKTVIKPDVVYHVICGCEA
jgi:hypothetical protein